MTDAKQLIIESKHGTFTVLYDAEDHDKASDHRWYVRLDSNHKFYVYTSILHPDGGWYYRPGGSVACSSRGKRDRRGERERSRTSLPMHRLIMDAPKGMDIDHINGNPLDNRKSNLRICTRAENMRNRGAQKNNTSGYKGVGWCKHRKKWHAQIKHNGKQIYIGRYKDKEEAARAYDAKAKELHGEYAHLNFPDE